MGPRTATRPVSTGPVFRTVRSWIGASRVLLAVGCSSLLVCLGTAPAAFAGDLPNLEKLEAPRVLQGDAKGRSSLPVNQGAARATRAQSTAPVLNEIDDTRSRFYRGHLLPRVERQLGQLGHYRWTEQAGLSQSESILSENILNEDVTRSAQKSLERATRRAFEDYFLEETALRFVVESLERRRGRNATNGAQRGTRRSVRWDLDVSHGLPQIEMRTRLAAGDVKLELALDGELGLAYRSPRTGRTAVKASFDPSRSVYELNARIAF